MRKSILNTRKGPVVFTDPCPTSPVSTMVDVLLLLATIAAIIVNITSHSSS